MKERTEEQILTKAPIEVTLGDDKYNLHPLSILKARAWRTKLVETMKSVVDPMTADQSSNNLGPAMTAALVAFPDKVSELVFAWQEDLPQDKILESASDDQLAVAFSAIMVMAYPFLAPLLLTMKVTKSQLA